MAAVRHLGFWKLAAFIMWPLSAWRSASAYKISPKWDNRSMSYDQKSDFQDGGRRHLEFQKFHHVTVTGFNQNRTIFQNGGRPTSWILHICIFCPVDLVSMPFCFLIQNFAEIGQSVNGQKWPKQRFSRWRQPPSWISKIAIFGHVTITGFNIWCSVPNFIKLWRFFTERWQFNDFQNGGRPPRWISKIYSFCDVAPVDLPFCFLIQNLAEIGQSVNE